MERGRGGEVIGSAAVLEGTHLCSTLQLRDMLPCLGGVSVLLPFIAQVTQAQALALPCSMGVFWESVPFASMPNLP